MKTVPVNLGSGYELTIGSGIIKSLGKIARSVPSTKNASHAFVVFDRNIESLHADSAIMSLKLAGYSVTQFIIKPGESARRLNTVADICSAAAASEMRSGDIFVAIGGVIACDIAGFAASLYLGGSPFIAVPTTLIGQVRRSVECRVNADLSEGRKMLGIYSMPHAVLCDTDTLKSQQKHSFNNGMAELIMLGCVASDKLLDDLADIETDPEKLISRAVTLRAKLAAKSERQESDCSVLQFGSLMARAIEEVSDYSMYHGEALAVGMAITCAAGERAGLTQVGTTDKLEAILRRHGLPTTTNIPAERLLKAIAEDRFVSGSTISLPLIKSIGNGFVHTINTVDLRGFFIQSLADWISDITNQ